MQNADLILVGGGPVGLSLALGLAQQGIRPALLDRVQLRALAEARYDGRASALSSASLRLLNSLGLSELIDQHAAPIWTISVTDGRPGEPLGPGELSFDSRDLGPEPLGAILENHRLRAALARAVLAQVEAGQIQLIEQAEVKALEPVEGGQRQISLASGNPVSAPLILAADGRNSALGKAAGLAQAKVAYAQSALVASLRHERPHAGRAFEHFLPGGPFAILPLPDAPGQADQPVHRASLVWTDETAKVEAFMQLDEAAFNVRLNQRFGDRLGQLSLDGKRWAYPLAASQAQRFIADRFALVGDAAHGVHPISGQGLNSGFKDVAVLLDVLGQAAREGQDLGSLATLRAYERWRRFDALTVLGATDSLNRLFSNDFAPLRLARGLGLNLVDQLTPLKRLFMQHAMGTLGTLPSRMQAKT